MVKGNDVNDNKSKGNTITFRLDDDCHNDLISEARNNNLPIATYTTQIINNYLRFYNKLEKRGDVPIPRKILREVYDSISSEKIQNVEKATTKFGLENLILTDNADFLDHILDSLTRWFSYSKLDFRVITESNTKKVRIACRHNLGKNWSQITMNSIISVLKDAGGKVSDTPKITEDIFAFNIVKP